MKPLFILVGSGLLLLSSVCTVRAENPARVRQLLQTNACENCDLSGTNLSDLDLEGANLQGANLQNSVLNRSQMNRANLRDANLQGAILGATNLRGANLQNAQLTDAAIVNFCPPNIDEGFCRVMRMLSALGSELCDDAYGLRSVLAFDPEILDRYCEQEGDIDYSFFSVDNVYDRGSFTLLLPVQLTGADLRGANLSNLDLSGADLRYANLSGANLSNANLTDTLLVGAELDGVVGATFEQAILEKSDVGELVVSLLEPQQQRAIESEARANTGAMNRAQQAYYIERGQFSDTIEALGLGLAPDTEHYRYEIVRVNADSVVQLAIPKAEGFGSYLGIVAVLEDERGERITQAVLCRATEPLGDLSNLPPVTPVADGNLICPAGFEDPFAPRQIELPREQN